MSNILLVVVDGGNKTPIVWFVIYKDLGAGGDVFDRAKDHDLFVSEQPVEGNNVAELFVARSARAIEVDEFGVDARGIARIVGKCRAATTAQVGRWVDDVLARNEALSV